MTEMLFQLPDVGEGLTEAEIVSWKVTPGESVLLNQVLVEIETAKSLVELPSPYEGIVGSILVSEGDTVDVGTPIISVVAQDAIVREPTLVGHGVSDQTPTRRRRAGAVLTAATIAPPPVSAPPPVTPDSANPVPSAAPDPAPSAAPDRAAGAQSRSVLAKPPVRKLARDLDVDLADVVPTGVLGDVTREDVLRAATQAKVFHNIETPAWPDAREERIAVKGVRKSIASAMVASAFTAPHVSVFVDVDATRTMEFVARLKSSPDFVGVKVSPLMIMCKAVIWAVRRNPTVNSTWTDREIIVHHFVNLGIAAATPRGLIVPNITDAQDLSLLELARALEELTNTARAGKTTPRQMSGGTITITNLGVFGMDTGTPILNPGEVSIVALGTIKPKPWVVDGDIRVRQVTTVGASFDHRVVDGDVASRFLADVAAVLEEPALLLD